MNADCSEKPCLVEARQGFSVLYRNRYLYSRYSPEDAVKKQILSLDVLPGTLFLCFSPVAGYGLEELLQKLKPDCFVLAVESNPDLFEFSKEHIPSKVAEAAEYAGVFVRSPAELIKLIVEGRVTPDLGLFKRVIPLEMSGGTAFGTVDYRECGRLAVDLVARFWKNRITLGRMGELFAKNLFKNISGLSRAQKLSSGCLQKPVLVVGAGPSAFDLLNELGNNHKKFFVLAVDMALKTCLACNVVPDAVVAVESQQAVEKAYCGVSKNNMPLIIGDLCSRAKVLRDAEKTSLFLTEYTDQVCAATFFARVKALLKEGGCPVFAPMGSVGLYAMELALMLRAPRTPVFVCGMDFSFPAGLSHAKGSAPHNEVLFSSTRLNPPENAGSAFGAGSMSVASKDGSAFYSNRVMYDYAVLFGAKFGDGRFDNVYDVGQTGINLQLPLVSKEQFFDFAEKLSGNSDNKKDPLVFASPQKISFQEKVRKFLTEEESRLVEIKEILTGKKPDPQSEKLKTLLSECSYLYIHFPDASVGFELSESFLKRVRSETDVFLKIIRGSLRKV
ncbi:MAG: DUF115 domain-containing protein [Treponemataceae bacterium]|nr:DUF115 domain-containing protein [Treponemataceae bacterium]